MRILIVGAKGDVGTAARQALAARHEIIAAGRNSGDVKVDLMDPASIRAMFAKLGRVDAIVATAGHSHFGPLVKMTEKDFRKGLDDKLMGQINLVLLGLDHVIDGGSITLTAGVLDRDPVRGGANAAAVNGAISAFVRSAALEMPRAIRINVVSPALLEDFGREIQGCLSRPSAGELRPCRPRLYQERRRRAQRPDHHRRRLRIEPPQRALPIRAMMTAPATTTPRAALKPIASPRNPMKGGPSHETRITERDHGGDAAARR